VDCAEKATAPSNPPPGSAIVALVTPNADDGAIGVTLHGPGISNLETASSGYLFYSRLVSDTVARVIVVGDLSAGPIFTFKVASGSAVSAYSVSIDQVATRADAVRSPLTNYSLTITAAP